MKKSAFFVLALFCLPFVAQAQFKAGLRAGLSTPRIDMETVRVNGLNVALHDAKYGYHVGLFLRGHLSDHIYLQPEFLFNSNKVDFKLANFTDNLGRTVFTEKYQNLDIPLMLGLKFGLLRLEGGPVGHVFIASKSELEDVLGNYEQHFNDLQVGYQAGGGFDIGRVLVDVRYEGSFNNFGEHMRIAGQEVKFSQNPSRLVMTVGFAF